MSNNIEQSYPKDNEPQEIQKSFSVIWKFTIHIFTGTALFALTYIPAIALNYCVNILEKINIFELSHYIIIIIQVVEFLLVFADSILFLWFLVKTTWQGVKEL